MTSVIYLGKGNPAGLLDVDESDASPGSRLKLGMIGAPGNAHHIVSYRDMCFDSANGAFWFRKNNVPGDPRNYTELVNIDGTGNMHVTGTLTAAQKQFDIPHPMDPEKLRLIHGCLEGPEHAVYYRGEGQIHDGTTTVQLPGYFEALTREGGRTVQLTPLADDDAPISPLAASEVRDGVFKVRALDRANPSQRFYWEVKAVRFDVEPLATEVPNSRELLTTEMALAGS
jgi:hypothetical protein